MKYTIEAIENAKPGMKWDEIGCHWTLGQAYLWSREAGNDLPNFAEVIWEDDIETIIADCRRLESGSSPSAPPSPASLPPSPASRSSAAAWTASSR